LKKHEVAGLYEEGEEQLYGATNLERLVGLERTYDSDGLLRMPGRGAA